MSGAEGPSHEIAGWASVARAGALTTVQDGGRPGWAHLGVPCSGAVDREAHARANRLVGNPETAAALETTLDGTAIRVEAAAIVAVTGASAPVLVNGRPAAWSLPIYLRAGDVLDVRPAAAGVRSYVAVGGGFVVAPVLGSRSTDLLSGLGPPPLVAGQRLPIGPTTGDPAVLDVAPYRSPSTVTELTVHPGPRKDWLTDDAAHALFTQRYGVSSASNRVGLRLVGKPLARSRAEELPSEGLVWGSVQVLPDGQLVVFLADHPTTGGYPAIGVVGPENGSACAQARPGSTVRLRPPSARHRR